MNKLVDGPNKKQLKWLSQIDKLTAKLGRKPTFAELAEAMGKPDQPSVASEMVYRLAKNGWLKNVRIEKWVITPAAREFMKTPK